MEAREETMAAASAAKTRPFSPTGTKDLINQGAALSFMILLSLELIKEGSALDGVIRPLWSAFMTKAIMPGMTTMSGRRSLRKAANTIPF